MPNILDGITILTFLKSGLKKECILKKKISKNRF